MKLIYKFPSRHRPDKFFAALENIKSLTTWRNYSVLATLDEDDPTMNNQEVKDRISRDYPEVLPIYGTSTSKVHACNRDMDKIDLNEFAIVILMSDDMLFCKEGFDNIIRSSMDQYFPNLDGVLHFPDSHGKFELSVLSIMGVEYYRMFGYLYHPDYLVMFCDNEYTDVARILNKYAFVKKKIYDHMHHIWGLSTKDELNIRNDDHSLYHKDNQTYLQRKSTNFGIDIFQ